MVDVSQASNDISLVGGPAIVNLVVDAGAQGQRGSQIFTGLGNPTDASVSLPSTQINDLFINLNPDSGDYLYLWQYNSQDGVIAWRKALRLIPNTFLANPLIKFINGQAFTTILDPISNSYIDVLGLFFPLGSFAETGDIANMQVMDFNVQHSVISRSNITVASSLYLKEITSLPTVRYINPLDPTGPLQSMSYDLGQVVLTAEMTATAFGQDGTGITSLIGPHSGYNIVHFMATIGGRSENILVFDTSAVSNNLISLPGHGMVTGMRVIYLQGPGDALINGVDMSPLVDQGTYYVVRVDEDTISLVNDQQTPILLETGTATGLHSLGIVGVGL